jgi:hypothetical protein
MASSSWSSSVAAFDASVWRAWKYSSRTCPAVAIASETWSPAATHSSRSSSYPVSAPLPPVRIAVAHNSVRGAMRIVGRSGSSVGSRSATSRARRQLVSAALLSRMFDQSPARMCHSKAARKSPAASRCSAINEAFSSAGPCASIVSATCRCSRARSDFSCESCATARISGLRNAYAGCAPNWTCSTSSAAISGVTSVSSTKMLNRAVSKRDPMTDAAFRVCFAAASNLSIRAPMVACSVAGTSAPEICRRNRYAPGCPSNTLRSARSRTISSTKNGFPAARSVMVAPTATTDGSVPSNSVVSVFARVSLSGCSAMVWAPETRISAPRYSGR